MKKINNSHRFVLGMSISTEPVGTGLNLCRSRCRLISGLECFEYFLNIQKFSSAILSRFHLFEQNTFQFSKIFLYLFICNRLKTRSEFLFEAATGFYFRCTENNRFSTTITHSLNLNMNVDCLSSDIKRVQRNES